MVADLRIDMNYSQVPLYSRTVYIIAHENGHIFGTPHTHTCGFWNDEGDPIDGCGTLTGSPGCDGPIPENGGTIMSYCNKLPGVGVNFANGFGDEPAMMLRNSIDSWGCLDMDCPEGPGYNCTFTVNEVVEPISRVKMSFIDNISTAYTPGTIPIQYFTDIPIHLQRGKSFEITVEGNTNGNYTNAVTAWIDWNRNGVWEEDEKINIGLLTDSNGEDGKSVSAVIYIPEDALLGRNRMKIIKSRGDFVEDACSPIDYGQAEDYELKITDRKITRIKLISNPPEGGQLRFYESITDEYFYFEGKNIMVYATSNEGYAFIDWTEEGEKINNFNKYSFYAGNDRELTANFRKKDEDSIYVYPNPFIDIIEIEASEIKEVKLFDITGKLIIRKEVPFLNEFEINTHSLEKGVYILNVETKFSKESFKLIKE